MFLPWHASTHPSLARYTPPHLLCCLYTLTLIIDRSTNQPTDHPTHSLYMYSQATTSMIDRVHLNFTNSFCWFIRWCNGSYSNDHLHSPFEAWLSFFHLIDCRSVFQKAPLFGSFWLISFVCFLLLVLSCHVLCVIPHITPPMTPVICIIHHSNLIFFVCLSPLFYCLFLLLLLFVCLFVCLLSCLFLLLLLFVCLWWFRTI